MNQCAQLRLNNGVMQGRDEEIDAPGLENSLRAG
eukprot:COSAG04_NODE_23092_length_344_cov_0.636735_1_plen_33_part_01